MPVSGGTLIAIAHDVSVAKDSGGEMIVIRDGNVVEAGPTNQVLQNPQADYTKVLIAADPGAWPDRPQKPKGEIIISAENHSVGRAGRTFVEAFDMRLHAGQRLALTGPSGIGKLTMLDTLGGMIKPLSGKVPAEQA